MTGAGAALAELRRRGVELLVGIGWLVSALLAVVQAVRDPAGLPVLLAAVGLVNLLPTLAALRGRADLSARLTVGTLAATHPALLVWLLRDHPWQMDAHMYFFVGLSALTVLCDWRPIAVASALIAGHHLLLEWLWPSWVFWGGNNFGRVVFHAAAVVGEAALLSYLTLLLHRLLEAQDAAVAQAAALAAAAETARAAAADALAAAGTAERAAAAERARHRAQEERVAVERQAELMVLAGEFERTVADVATSILASSVALEQSAIELDDAAGAVDVRAGAVAMGAERCTAEMREVAVALGGLGASLGTVADAARQQNELTGLAQRVGARSLATGTTLNAHVDQIAGFVADIRGIAGKTNLLALNAAIEAAHAGEAGRGFAVVAGEVKALSADARRASERIGALLSAIRDGVADTAEQLGGANRVIDDVARAAAEIAAAVAEQQGYAREIDGGAARATRSAEHIEGEAGGVATAVTAAVGLAGEVRGSAGLLAAGARDLRLSTRRFVSFLRDGEGEAPVAAAA